MSVLSLGRKNKGQGKDGGGKFKYPGSRAALDGNSAVIMCERESSDAAGAYPITPSTQMGEYWAEAAAAGHINVSERPLIFIEPEGEHAAAAVTAAAACSPSGSMKIRGRPETLMCPAAAASAQYSPICVEGVIG